MQGLLVPMCTYSIVAIGLNLCVGYLGELSIGHAGFMCVGAFQVHLQQNFTECDPKPDHFIHHCFDHRNSGSSVFGFLIGIPVLRLRGDYLAIVTLAFGEIIKT